MKPAKRREPDYPAADGVKVEACSVSWITRETFLKVKRDCLRNKVAKKHRRDYQSRTCCLKVVCLWLQAGRLSKAWKGI